MPRPSEGDIAQATGLVRAVRQAIEPLSPIGASQYYFAVPPLLTSAPNSVSNYVRPVQMRVVRESGEYYMSYVPAQVDTQQGMYLNQGEMHTFLLHPDVQTVGVTAVTGTGNVRVNWIFIDPLP